MVRLERLHARWFAFRTEVVLCTLFSVLLNAATSEPHNLIRLKLAKVELHVFYYAVNIAL